MVHIDEHPLLDARVLLATWPGPLGELPNPDWMDDLAGLDADTPFDDADEVLDGPHKKAVRDLLRHGGFKPSGRSKPCWEYMRGVARKGAFPRINPAVDATNAAALHGALPVSTGRRRPPGRSATHRDCSGRGVVRVQPIGADDRFVGAWSACTTRTGRARMRSRMPSAPRPTRRRPEP